MAKVHSIAQEAVLVAIDISKKRNDVQIQIPGSTRRRRLTVSADRVRSPGTIGHWRGAMTGIGARVPMARWRPRRRRTTHRGAG